MTKERPSPSDFAGISSILVSFFASMLHWRKYAAPPSHAHVFILIFQRTPQDVYLSFSPCALYKRRALPCMHKSTATRVPTPTLHQNSSRRKSVFFSPRSPYSQADKINSPQQKVSVLSDERCSSRKFVARSHFVWEENCARVNTVAGKHTYTIKFIDIFHTAPVPVTTKVYCKSFPLQFLWTVCSVLKN